MTDQNCRKDPTVRAFQVENYQYEVGMGPSILENQVTRSRKEVGTENGKQA